MRPRPVARQRDRAVGKPSYWHELKEGFRYVAGSSWLWVTVVLFAFGNIFTAGATVVLLPLLADARFGGAAALGWLLSGMAGGALVAALVLNRVALRRRGWAAYLGVAVAGLGLVGVALAPTVVFGVLATAIVGASLTVFGVVWETTVQALVSEEVLGRVVSLDMLGSFALLPLGFVVTGSLAQVSGAPPLILVYGGITTGLALTGLLVPAIKQLD